MPALAVFLWLAIQDPIDEKDAVKIGCLGGQTMVAFVDTASSACVQYILTASRLAGRERVVAGTLRQTSEEEFVYDPKPADRLRVEFADGSVLVFTIPEAEGNLSRDARRFLAVRHALKFKASADKAFELDVTSRRSGGKIEASAAGKLTVDKVEYSIDTKIGGSYTFSMDGGPGGEEYFDPGMLTTTDRTVKGTMAARGLEVKVDETFTYKMVYHDRFVENAIVTARNSWTLAGRSYALRNWRVRKSFLDGDCAELGSYWVSEGAVLRDGKTFGRLRMKTGDPDHGEPRVRLELATDDKPITIEEWAR